jgi:tetratricopeptide (TPR) repeat protein
MGDDPMSGADVDDVARLWTRLAETEGLERAGVLDELGGVLLEADRDLEAISVVESARQLYIDAGDDAEVARCDRNLGLLLTGVERNDEALLHYAAACETYDAHLLLADAAGCRQAVAEITAAAGDGRTAVAMYERAAGAFAEAGDLVRAGWCRFDAAALLAELGDDEPADVMALEARHLFRDERAYLFVARVDCIRAEIARRAHRFDEALDLLVAARAVFESSGSDGEVDRCDDSRAEVLIDASRAAEAVAELEAHREERRSSGNAVGAAWCDLHLSRAYGNLGRPDEAATSRCTARAVFDAAGFDDVLERAELATA